MWRVTAQPLPARVLGWAFLEGIDAPSPSSTNIILKQRYWDNPTGSLPVDPFFKASSSHPSPCILFVAGPVFLLFHSQRV